MGRDLGFAQLVTAGCVLLYAATLLYQPEAIRAEGFFSLLAPGGEALARFGMSGAAPVFGWGRWWTVLSAAWLHGGLLHIALNLWWIRGLVAEVAEVLGIGRTVVVYTAGSIGGFALTSVMGLFALPDFLRGAFYSVGASAPLFGLFGALVLYARRTGRTAIAQHYLQFAVVWVVVGFIAGSGSRGIAIDNWAHLGGFAGGYLAALFLDPLREETPTHGVLAIVCLAATAASIVASFLLPVPL